MLQFQFQNNVQLHVNLKKIMYFFWDEIKKVCPRITRKTTKFHLSLLAKKFAFGGITRKFMV